MANRELDGDLRQYQRMLEAVNDYQASKLSLNGLISALEGLIGSLHGTSTLWKNEFMRQWGTLEDVFSFAVVEKQGHLDEQDLKLVARAVEKLGAQIQTAIEVNSSK
jgi:hypothetical protein